MRSIWELVVSCGCACSSTSMVKEEARLLVASGPPASGGSDQTCRGNNNTNNNIRGRKRGRGTARNSSFSGGVEWRPSLTSISEDNVLHHERNRMVNHDPHNQDQVSITVVRPSSPSSASSSQRNLKRKIKSAPRPARSNSPQEDVRRPAVHVVMPAFSPAPFMF